LAGGLAERQAAYAELEALARQRGGDTNGAAAIHVGGLEGELEECVFSRHPLYDPVVFSMGVLTG
jgi:hypothetical protein